ncbi:MAG TPA: chromate transporter [Geobacteraceae bacterium]|nr:chromate transporter [Geobacteraceae bacterium]
MDIKPRVSLREIFTTFLIIGTTGFGGGMAVVSLTERCCVREKKWLTIDEFLHGLAFGQILGPFSLNTCTFVGYYLRGIIGGIVASVAFILPSFCLISLLTWLYFRFHQLPQLESALKGTNPVVIAVILVAVVAMTKSTVKGVNGWMVALIAFVGAAFFKVSSLIILVLGAVWAFARAYCQREST